MSSKQGGKEKPFKQPKAEKKEYDEIDKANIQKKKEEEKALKELKAKAQQKGSFGGSGLKKVAKNEPFTKPIASIETIKLAQNCVGKYVLNCSKVTKKKTQIDIELKKKSKRT